MVYHKRDDVNGVAQARRRREEPSGCTVGAQKMMTSARRTLGRWTCKAEAPAAEAPRKTVSWSPKTWKFSAWTPNGKFDECQPRLGLEHDHHDPCDHELDISASGMPAAWRFIVTCFLTSAIVAHGIGSMSYAVSFVAAALAAAAMGKLRSLDVDAVGSSFVRQLSPARPRAMSEGGALVGKIKGCPLPGGRWFQMNPPDPFDVQAEHSHVRACGLVFPTNDPAWGRTARFPYSDYFAGKRRIWEFRMQIRFKVIPEQLYFGIEVDSYAPMSRYSAMAYSVLKRLVFGYFGSGLYHANGDDPGITQGELEPPTFAMPLWGMDQIIVSDIGQEPHLCGNLEGMGVRRTDGMSKFKAALGNFRTDKMYTCCFWGPSRYAEICNWEIAGLPGGFRFPIGDLAGPHPFRMVVYDLGKGHNAPDSRHLRSRKRYFCNIAVWHEDYCQPPADTIPDE